jgi:hypothetical protein
MKNINPYYFLISLAVGMFFVYISTPPPEVIIEYPTPENAGKVIYKEDNNLGCYTYMAKKVSCPIDDDDISKIPYQGYKNKEKNEMNPFKKIYNILSTDKNVN